MRTFEELRGPTDTWCTSLAYWLGVYRGKTTSEKILEIANAVSFQYDFEEQADRYGRVFPEDASWPKVFSPVAPIQLTDRWSPAARAAELLGQPSTEAVAGGPGIRTVAMAWSIAGDVKPTALRVRSQRPAGPDEKRFVQLLAAVVFRSAERHAHVLLIAQPGWSYDRIHPLSDRTASLMTKAGFVLTSRTP